MLNIKRNFRFSFLLVLTVSLLTSVSSPSKVNAAPPAPTPTLDPVTSNFVNLAQSKLDAENNVLITGDSISLTSPKFAVSGAAAQGVNDVVTVQLRRNKMLADHGQRYSKVVSKIIPGKVDIANGSATVTAEEDVTATLVDKMAKAPVITQEVKNHTFHYSQQGGKWVLTDDTVVNPFVPVLPEPGAPHVTGKPISIDSSAQPSGVGSQRNKLAPSSGGAMAAAVIHGSFNPQSAVNYANTYWNNYNPSYRSYGNDCTNFISQADNWSGWQHITGWYSDDNNWWYSNSPVVQWGGRAEARSWINVQDYYFFARNSGRAFNATSFNQFIIGDTLQVDFGTPDGILDHNTLVTGNNGNGNIFLTYHSTNTHNISIWDFIARTPGANYYGTLNYSGY